MMKLSRLLYLLFVIFFSSIFCQNILASELKESWMNIYSGNEKVGEPIGYSYSKIERKGSNTVVYEESEIKIKVFESENSVSTKAKYKLINEKIESLEYSLESYPQNYRITGFRKGEKFVLTTKTNTDSNTQEYNIDDSFLVSPLIPTWLAKGRLKAGDNYEVYVFDPFLIVSGFQKEKFLSKISVLGLESISLGSGKVSAYKVNFNFFGFDSEFWVKEDGTIVKEIIPPGLVSLKSSKNDVVGRKLKSLDLLSKTSIKTKKKISNPRKIKFMKFTLDKINNEYIEISDGYSQYQNEGIYEIKANDLDKGVSDLSFNSKNFIEYLSPTNFVQSNNEKIKGVQVLITKDAKSKLEGIKKINSWVYENIEKIPVFSIPHSLDVLNSKKGDCNEHAVLFAALARSYGIPTKIALGIVYLNDRFYYHAWNEVYLGKWIPVDPTFGQLPSDATHIKLIEGGIENSIEIIKLVGKLNIRILEVY